jgi:hypothetical protein
VFAGLLGKGGGACGSDVGNLLVVVLALVLSAAAVLALQNLLSALVHAELRHLDLEAQEERRRGNACSSFVSDVWVH